MFRKRKDYLDSPVIPYKSCFAKSTEDDGAGMLVLDHCRLAGAIASKLLRSFPNKDLFPTGAPFIVSAHDVGKVSPGFLKNSCGLLLQDFWCLSWTKNTLFLCF